MKWMAWIGVIVVIVGVLISILGMFLGWLGVFIGILLIFIRSTTVPEGTAKVITRFGGEVKVFIQWVGYTLDQKGNVVPVTGLAKKPWYGGLRVWIGTPWDKEHEYDLRWHSVEEIQGKRVPVFREKITNNVNLRPDRYWRKSTKLETADGQFPDVEWLVGLRSINPGKTIFKSPHNWIENALTELEPTLRAYGRTKTLEGLLDLTREQIWKDIGNDRAIQVVLKTEWGIQIDEQEIGIFDANLPPEDQAALAAEKREDLIAKAKIAVETREREAEKIELQHVRDRAQEIRDGVGLSPKDAIEVVQTERGKVVKQIIEYKGLEGVRGLPLINIGGEIPIGRGPREERERPREEKERKPRRRKFPTKEEVEETLRKTYEKK
jgi:hypothetical protein